MILVEYELCHNVSFYTTTIMFRNTRKTYFTNKILAENVALHLAIKNSTAKVCVAASTMLFGKHEPENFILIENHLVKFY